jgi:hypothetical protein
MAPELIHRELTASRIQSGIAADAVRLFVASVDGNAFDITEGNDATLSQLCNGLDCDGVSLQLPMCRPREGPISALKRRPQHSERQVTELH